MVSHSYRSQNGTRVPNLDREGSLRRSTPKPPVLTTDVSLPTSVRGRSGAGATTSTR